MVYIHEKMDKLMRVILKMGWNMVTESRLLKRVNWKEGGSLEILLKKQEIQSNNDGFLFIL